MQDSKQNFLINQIFGKINITNGKVHLQKNIKKHNNVIWQNTELINQIIASSEYLNHLYKTREDYLKSQKDKEKIIKRMNLMKGKHRKEFIKYFYEKIIDNIPPYLIDMIDFYKLNLYKNKLLSRKNIYSPLTQSKHSLTENFSHLEKIFLNNINKSEDKKNNRHQTKFKNNSIDFNLITEYAAEKDKLDCKSKILNKFSENKSYQLQIKPTNINNYSNNILQKQNTTKIINRRIFSTNEHPFKSDSNIINNNTSLGEEKTSSSNMNNISLSPNHHKETLTKNSQTPNFRITPYRSNINLSKQKNKKTNFLLTTEIKNCKYIPLRNKYKEINYHKNCIFNNEFHDIRFENKKIHSKTTKCLELRKRDKLSQYKINSSSDLSIKANDKEEKIIKSQINKIINNLKEIGSVMLKDKNYTHNSINRYIIQRKKNSNKEEFYMKNEIVQELKIDNFIRHIQKKINYQESPFKSLKQCLGDVRKTKKRSITIEEINKKLTKFNREEHKIRGIHKKVLTMNYDIRRANNRKSYLDIKKTIKSMENNEYIMHCLGEQINNCLSISKEKLKKRNILIKEYK